MEYRIRCPHHEADETVEVPGNPQVFHGEINCSPPAGQTAGPLKISIIHGLLVDAALSKRS